jgi:hypothetical protein
MNARSGNSGDAVVNASLEISRLIDGWFRKGSYPLVAIGIGTLITFAYVFALNIAPLRQPLSRDWQAVFGLGAALITGGFLTALIAGTRVRKEIQRSVKEYEKTIETAQEFSRESVKAIRHLNELLFTHVDTVAQVIDAASPILGTFGGASLANSRYLESDLVAFSNKAQEVIVNVEKAITLADFKALQQYRNEIGLLASNTKTIVERVKSGEWAADQVADFTKSISSARQAALAYSNSATRIHERINATAEPIIILCQAALKAPLVGTWLQGQGMSGHIGALQRLQALIQKAQNANLAVGAAIATPGREKLEAALQHMQSLRASMDDETNAPVRDPHI